MTRDSLPLLLDPELLEGHLGEPELLILDVRTPQKYLSGHIPGAVNVSYADFVAPRPPAMGLLPDEAALSAVLSGVGLTESAHVVAYDDEGGGRAARVLWTLDVLGHAAMSLLDGGLLAWQEEDRAMVTDAVAPTPRSYVARVRNSPAHASREQVLSLLGRDGVAILDTRTLGEFTGEDVRASRGGHIPGAVNRNWTDNLDRNNSLRLLPEPALRAAYLEIGVSPEKTVVAYCQTHHRSAHSYIVLKHLGYQHVSGYAGAWSEWGNDPDLPVEA